MSEPNHDRVKADFHSAISNSNLRELGLVDCDHEESFDNLTRLAQSIFNVPVALISLVEFEKDRQYFKSLQGLPEPWASERQTPLTHSFCQHVVVQDKPLVVEDASMDQLVCDNLAIRDLDVQSYLGVPVYLPEKKACGALCVIDGKPRKWSDADVEKLKQLGHCVDDLIRIKATELQLKSVNENLERSNADLQEFAYVASHDLQEPARKMISFCGLLDKEYRDQLDEEGQSYIDFIVDGSKRMQTLIRDLLELSRVQTESSDLKVFDSRLAVEAAEALIELSGGNKSATVIYDQLPKVRANQKQMTQLFHNLISNAIKYNENETAKINISAKRKKGEVVFSVSDNGIGISPEHFERIFGVFKRLHGKSSFSGSGIGLAICKKIVERWNGRIWVESDVGSGSTFHFSCPACADTAEV